MKTITIRVEDELFEEIEEKRGNKQKSVFYREIIEDHLNKNEDNLNKTEYVTRLGDEVKYLRGKVDELTKLLHQEQSLHLQTQRMLPGVKGKRWWQFWK